MHKAYKSKMNKELYEICHRYKVKEDSEVTQIHKDISYLMMTIRQKDYEIKQLEAVHEQQQR